jgi:hypothetical protein
LNVPGRWVKGNICQTGIVEQRRLLSAWSVSMSKVKVTNQHLLKLLEKNRCIFTKKQDLLFWKTLPGVWRTFSRHSPNWRIVQYFHSPKQKTTGRNIEQVSERG